MAEGFHERDRQEMTDDQVRLDIKLEALQMGSLPTGMFTRRQVRLIEELREAGELVEGEHGFTLSEEEQRKLKELINKKSR